MGNCHSVWWLFGVAFAYFWVGIWIYRWWLNGEEERERKRKRRRDLEYFLRYDRANLITKSHQNSERIDALRNVLKQDLQILIDRVVALEKGKNPPRRRVKK